MASALANLDEAIELLEKANADLEPALVTVHDARRYLARYAALKKLAAWGETAFARRVNDAKAVAEATGTSVGQAQSTIDTGATMADAPALDEAMRRGELSPEQATEIGKAEAACAGAADALVDLARRQPFTRLRDEARRRRLEAEAEKGLADRQREARRASHRLDDLGMYDVRLRLQPHVGAPIVNAVEAEAKRLSRAAGRAEPFERYLADAYAALLAGKGKGRARRADVVVVSDGVVTRNFTDVRPGEVCRIPGVGPVAPEVARERARDAVVSWVIVDGTEVTRIKRWTRSVPPELALLLEVGDPPHFDGRVCRRCGHRFHVETDHIDPVAAGGPTEWANLQDLCWECHVAKTEQDRRAGKFKPRGP